MDEEYREYRSRRDRTAKKTAKKNVFPKKLGYQTLISLALLIAVCTLKFSDNEGIVNTYIKSAVLYQPDTSALADMLGNILNFDTEEVKDNEETSTPQNL